jgi:hypothetical protein
MKSRRRSSAAQAYSFFVLVLLAYMHDGVYSFSNPTIVENELGTTAVACADTYCVGKDSLDLWLQIATYCHEDELLTGSGSGYSGIDSVSSIIQAPSRRRLEGRRKLVTEQIPDQQAHRSYELNVLISAGVGLLCAVASVGGVLIGLYVSGSGKVLIPFKLLNAKTLKDGYTPVAAVDDMVNIAHGITWLPAKTKLSLNSSEYLGSEAMDSYQS